jgi:hypothetical protein
LSYGWNGGAKAVMIIIGVGTSIVCAMSLFVNVYSLVRKVGSHRLLIGGWIGGIGLLGVLEVVSLVKYFHFGDSSEYMDVVAKKILGIFMVVNLMDCLFWMWGLKMVSE